MAGWLDWINTIQDDEERRKRQEQGGLGGMWGNIQNGWENTGDFVGNLFTGKWDKLGGNIAKGAGTTLDFLGDTAETGKDILQGIPRGVVALGADLEEWAKPFNNESAKQGIDKMIGSDKSVEDRNKMADNWNIETLPGSRKDQSYQAKFYAEAREKFGDTSDESLRKLKDWYEKDKTEHVTITPDTAAEKFFLGDKPIDSHIKTSDDTKKELEAAGVDSQTAGNIGIGAGLVMGALDAPTGLGSLVKSPLKQLGKQGIAKLAKETTQEGVEAILKGNIKNISDDAVKELAPKLIGATDNKMVRSIIGNYGDVTGGTLKGMVEGTNGKAVQTAKEKLLGKPTTPSGFGEASDEILGSIRTTKEVADANKKSIKDSFREQFVDKLSPVYDMVKTIEDKTGSKLATEDNPYELMRLYNGMPDMVQQRVRGLTDVLKQSPDLNAVKTVGMARQIIDRAEKTGVGSFVSTDKARAAIDEVRAKLGPEAFDRAAATVDSVVKYNRGLLDDLHDSQIISDAAYDAINEAGINYFSRFNVIDYMLQNDTNRALFSKTGSYNTTKESIKKVLAEVKGMQEGTLILDPIESIVKSTDQTMRAIAKNEIWHSFNRLADEVPDMVVRVRDPNDVAERIALSLDNKEMIPVRNKLDRLISTRGGWIKKLESQINALEKKGMNISLKKGGERMTAGDFLVDGLGGTKPTSQTGKFIERNITGEGGRAASDFVDMVNPQKLGPQDTGRFVRNLIEKGSQGDIDRLKRMVGTRDARLSSILDEVGKMKTQFDDLAGSIKENRMRIHELTDKDAPEGMKLISGFGQGIQGKLAVPEEIADVFTGKSKAQQDYVTSLFSKVNTFVKQNFTSNNPTFAFITNPIRDAKTFAYNAKDVKSDPYHIGKALAEGVWARTFGKGELYDKWVASGGRSGFYADERSADKMAEDMLREISGKKFLGVKVREVHNAKDFMREVGQVMGAPFRAMHGAASILEDAPRLAQFKASLDAGKTTKEAAFNSRNVTVDFQQAGRIGQVVNAWIPFLNARFQGTLKSAQAIKRDPVRAASVYATLTAAPILTAAYNNYVRFPDVMKNLNEGDRDNNFIIVLGDHKDEKGNYDQVLKIPKSDVDKILGNPLEQVTRYIAQDDPETLGEILTNMVGSTSPVDLVKDDKFNASRAAGGLLPPLLKAPIEAATNHNFYFDSPVVSDAMSKLPDNEQVKDNTGIIAKTAAGTIGKIPVIGDLTGGESPIKQENTARNFLGSLVGMADDPTKSFGSKLVGASGNKMTSVFYTTLNETEKNRTSASRYIDEAIAKGDYAAAQQAAQAYNQYLVEKFTPFADEYGSQMTPELAKVYDKQKIVLSSRSISQRQRRALEKQAGK